MGSAISASQRRLTSLTDSLRAYYLAQASDSAKKAVLADLPRLLNRGIWRKRLDSIQVHVDEVKIEGWKITTTFHHDNIQFKFRLTFKDEKDAKDSLTKRPAILFKFMKGLRVGSDRIVNFEYLGNCEVNSPDSQNLYIFRIFAIPTPLSWE